MNFAELLKFDLVRSWRTPVFLWVLVTYLVGSTAGLLLVWPGTLRLGDLAAPSVQDEFSLTGWLSGRVTFAWVVTIQLFFLGFAAALLAAAPGWREEDISLQAFAAGAPQTPAVWVVLHSLAVLGQLGILALAGLPVGLAALGTRVLTVSTLPGTSLEVRPLVTTALQAGLAGMGYLFITIAAGTLAGLHFDPIFRYPAACLLPILAGLPVVVAGEATGMAFNPFAAVWTLATYLAHPASRPILADRLGSFWPAALLWSSCALGGVAAAARNVRVLRKALWASEPAVKTSYDGQEGESND